MWLAVGTGLVGLALGIVGTVVAPSFAPAGARLARKVRAVLPESAITMTVMSGGYDYYFPHDLPIEPPPASAEEWESWAVANGGVEWGEMTVSISLVCASPITLILKRPIVLASATPAPNGKHACIGVGGGPSGIETIRFDVDLSSRGIENPVISLVSDGGRPLKEPLAWVFPDGDAKMIQLRVKSSSHNFVCWRAQLPVIADGQTRLLDVTNDGEDFIFVGSRVEVPSHYSYSATVDGTPEWTSYDPPTVRFNDRDAPTAN